MNDKAQTALDGSLVVLGDCATNGNNTLAHEVFQDPDITTTFSIQYHSVTSKHAMRWYLKHGRDRHRSLELDLDKLEQAAIDAFNREFQMDPRLQGPQVCEWYLRETRQRRGDFLDTDQLKAAALSHLRRRESQNSWVNLLDVGSVHHYSVNGNHFGNYLVRIQRHVAQHGRPGLVLITDYSPDHVFTNLRHQGTRYTALMSDSYLYMDYDDQATYPEAVYELRRRRYIREKNQTQRYRDRKSRRYQRLLEKYLDQQGIPHKYILYRQPNLQFVEGKDFIDLRPVFNQWCGDSDGHNYLAGQNSRIKSETQADCARLVQEKIKGLL